jgi:hypothetical protein
MVMEAALADGGVGARTLDDDLGSSGRGHKSAMLGVLVAFPVLVPAIAAAIGLG